MRTPIEPNGPCLPRREARREVGARQCQIKVHDGYKIGNPPKTYILTFAFLGNWSFTLGRQMVQSRAAKIA